MVLGTNRNFLGFDEDLLSYVDSVSSPEPAVLVELRQETLAHPLAICQVTHRQGLFLQLMVKATGAKKAMDVGTFTGYSGLCMAMALPASSALCIPSLIDLKSSSSDFAIRFASSSVFAFCNLSNEV